MKERRKRNTIWHIPLEVFKKDCDNAETISSILKKYDLRTDGRNVHIVIQRAARENIDISHIPLGINSNRGRAVSHNKLALSDILKENTKINRGYIKRRLLKEGLLSNKCSVCGLGGTWNDKPLVLVLDHINGINNDYRMENLRLVCPNCNSQLDTFAGRNIKKYQTYEKKNVCIDCKKEIHYGNKRCFDCYIQNRYYK